MNTAHSPKNALTEERTRLEQGEDTLPPPPFWRSSETARASLSGAPLWQLIDFQPQIGSAERAGLEAALQAAGLLDAWVTPDGTLWNTDQHPVPHDVQWLTRPRHTQPLSDWLMPAATTPEHSLPVAATVVQRLLEGVSCSMHDPGDTETWVAPDGRFRLGALAGAWRKPEAGFIGYAARAAARHRRLADIAAQLKKVGQALALLQEQRLQIEADQQRAALEWESAPADDRLRSAHAVASACAREFRQAELRLEQADAELRNAAAALTAARTKLAQDAEDLRLPSTRDALDAVDRALAVFTETVHTLVAAHRELNDARNEHARQLARERQEDADAEHAAHYCAEREAIAEDVTARLEALRESVGTKVQALQQQISNARQTVIEGEAVCKQCNEALRCAGEDRARTEQQAETAEALLAERSTARQHAIEQLRTFCATGLAAAALPDAEIPATESAWTLEAALTLARRAEQRLANIDDDDDTWTRIQNRISHDYTELGRALAALSHQAQAETSDFGLMVSIIYQNRRQRPDELGAHLADEIAQRRELLTAGEREVLENHLQAEIASAVQKLLRDADRQVNAINAELQKRPTSTGVRFQLKWETLPEGADGAPVGLEAARDRLLNKSPDLWSADERRAVGEMLQQRIAAERSRAEAGLGGSLLEQLARALDYRHWHRFRVQRWDGKWMPLSGPASSGERALGLTVPLFAAVSSYYTQESYAHAPRLVLLDEVFAGIDNAARAHCWALIREFDLDFVVTSEREWACSVELPGVAIAQLQRREGIDAVHVSRWTWDGRATRPDPDPDRRYPPE